MRNAANFKFMMPAPTTFQRGYFTRATASPQQRSAVVCGPLADSGVMMATRCPARLSASAMVRSCDSAPPPPRLVKFDSSTIRMRSGGASRCIDVPPQPQLEHQEAEQVIRVVPAAALVIRDQLLDELAPPEAACDGARVEQRLAHHLLERRIGAHPHADGQPEALLLLLQDLCGQDAARRLLEEVALGQAADLVLRRQPIAPLDAPWLEIGKAHAHAACARGAVDLAQIVLRD